MSDCQTLVSQEVFLAFDLIETCLILNILRARLLRNADNYLYIAVTNSEKRHPKNKLLYILQAEVLVFIEESEVSSDY